LLPAVVLCWSSHAAAKEPFFERLVLASHEKVPQTITAVWRASPSTASWLLIRADCATLRTAQSHSAPVV